MNDIKSRTLDGFLWMFVGTGGHLASQAVMLAALARLITPKDFGLVGAAMVVVRFSSIFSRLGVGPALIHIKRVDSGYLRTGFTISVVFGAVLTGIIYFSAPVISAFFRMESLPPILRAIAVVFFLQGFGIVGESMLQRNLKFRHLAAIQSASFGFSYCIVGVGLALLGFGAWSLVGAHVMQAGLGAASMMYFSPIPIRPLIAPSICRELLFFSGGFTASRIGEFIALQSYNIVVGRWLGAEALGMYGRAYQLMALPAMLFGQVLDGVLFPAMAKLQDRKDQLSGIYKKTTALVSLSSLPVSAFCFVFAPEIICIVLGTQWDEAVVPFKLLSIALLFRAAYTLPDSLARATGAVYRKAWRQGIQSVVTVCGAILGTRWGLDGVAAGVTITMGFHYVFMAGLSLRLTGMHRRSFVHVHVPALIVGGIVFFESYFFAELMRLHEMYASVTVLSAAVLVCATLWVLFRFLPAITLGDEGIWIKDTAFSFIREKIKRL